MTALFSLALMLMSVLGVGGGPVAAGGQACKPVPGPVVQAPGTGNGCFPTPQECKSGGFNGVHDGGPPGRGSVCLASGGTVIVYAGGNAAAQCGDIIVAGTVVAGKDNDDPNTCPK
jgi:hypothetical protein